MHALLTLPVKHVIFNREQPEHDKNGPWKAKHNSFEKEDMDICNLVLHRYLTWRAADTHGNLSLFGVF